MKRILLISNIVLFAAGAFAQQEAPDVRRGNKQYNKQDFTAAEVDYRRGLEKNGNSFEGHYNLGNALFKQDKYPEAQAEYQKAAQLLDSKQDKKQLAESYHNLGNAYFAQQQYDKAIAAYQQSLRNNPKDNDTRYNLVKAMQMLQEQQQQQQKQDQNKDQNQDQQQNQQQQQDQQDEQNQPPIANHHNPQLTNKKANFNTLHINTSSNHSANIKIPLCQHPIHASLPKIQKGSCITFTAIQEP